MPDPRYHEGARDRARARYYDADGSTFTVIVQVTNMACDRGYEQYTYTGVPSRKMIRQDEILSIRPSEDEWVYFPTANVQSVHFKKERPE